MNEAEWNLCTNVQEMLDFLRVSAKLPERKARLFAVSVCRRIWPLFTDERSRQAIEMLERFAEGTVGMKELAEAALKAEEVLSEKYEDPIACVALNAVWADLPEVDTRLSEELRQIPLDCISNAKDTAYAASFVRSAPLPLRTGEEVGFTADPVVEVIHCQLLRCLVGNPFMPEPRVESSWLTPTVLSIAQAVYRSYQLPEGTLIPASLRRLAAALEAVGCKNTEILAHLRAAGPHTRWCWAVDLILKGQ